MYAYVCMKGIIYTGTNATQALYLYTVVDMLQPHPIRFFRRSKASRRAGLFKRTNALVVIAGLVTICIIPTLPHPAHILCSLVGAMNMILH